MDWKCIAIEKLKGYQAKRQAIENIPLKIFEVEAAMTSIRSAGSISAPIAGSKGNAREDMYIRNLDRLDELKRQLERAKMFVDIVDRALSVLSADDRLVLERLYVNHEKCAAERLCNDLGLIEARSVYKRRESAIRQFTIAMYGCTES